jgi:serine phosphatase RsbU (regulator of sigma subunit)
MGKVSSDARFCLLTHEDPAVAISNLNNLMNQPAPSDRFVTLAVALLDPAENSVTLVSAGQVPPLIYHRASALLEKAMPVEVAGFPLGVVDGYQYESCKVYLEPGDFILTFTDGIPDARNKEGVAFPMGSLEKAVQTPCSPQTVGERLLEAVKQFSHGCQQHDDITVVCFGRI